MTDHKPIFTANVLIELKQRDKVKIEAIATNGDKVLVGTNHGTLRVYRVSRDKHALDDGGSAKSQKPRVPKGELLREIDAFAKSKIEQLDVSQSTDILVSLSGSCVHLHDLQGYRLRETLSRTKGATLIALSPVESQEYKSTDRKTGQITKLAVVVKRKLLVWTWMGNKLDEAVTEVALATTIRSLAWISGDRIMVGLNQVFVLVDPNKGKVIAELACPEPEGSQNGHEPSRFGGTSVPGYLSMTSQYPICVRYRDRETLLLKDTAARLVDYEGVNIDGVPGGWSVPPHKVICCNPYILMLNTTKGLLEVFNRLSRTSLQKIELSQITSMLQTKDSTASERNTNQIWVFSDRTIWQLESEDPGSSIDSLLQMEEYDEASKLTQAFDDDQYPGRERRMKDIAILKAKRLFSQRRYKDAIDLFIEIHAPPLIVLALYPSDIVGALSERTNDSIRLADDDIKDAVGQLRGFLASTRAKLKRILAPDGSIKPDGKEIVTSIEMRAFAPQDQILDLDRDHDDLIHTARTVDTALFRAYMLVSPSFAGPLVRVENFCDPEVVESALLAGHRYNELIDFWHSRGFHRKVLDLLQSFGDLDEANTDAPQLFGPQRTVAYLQNLPSKELDLILHFAKWPLLRDPDMALQIFTADSEHAESLPRLPVFNFLQDIDEHQALRYLEHVVLELDDTTAVLQQHLLDSYIKSLEHTDSIDNDGVKAKQQRLHDFLEHSTSYSPYKVLQRLPDHNATFLEARTILLRQTGQHQQALEILAFDLHDEEKASEYCSRVYLDARSGSGPAVSKNDEMHDISEVGSSSSAETSIYHNLLGIYLSPPSPHPPNLPAALKLLSTHGTRIDAEQVLNLVPSHLALTKLQSYLQAQLRALRVKHGQLALETQLQNVLNTRTQEELCLGKQGAKAAFGVQQCGRTRHVVVEEQQVCAVCLKRFGGSAIKVMPDNKVLHYGCEA